MGPLPAITSATVLRNPAFKRSNIPYSLRNMFWPPDSEALYSFVAGVMVELDNAVHYVTGYRLNNCSDHCLSIFPGIPGSFDNDTRQAWVFLHRYSEGYPFQPIGLTLRIDMAALDPREWRINYIWFRGYRYGDLDELKRALRQMPRNEKDDMSQAPLFTAGSIKRSLGNSRCEQRGPRLSLPDGPRYAVRGHQVSWQGWEFAFSLKSVTGLQLHDLKFKGERVAYEISLSEIAVVYAGGKSLQLQTAFLDLGYLNGANSFELFSEIECPEDASYFDFVHYVGYMPTVYKNSACLFEWRNAIPLRRHYERDASGGYKFWHGMSDNVLILRSFINMYMYDYLIDYTFHQNGMLAVTCSFSGHVVTSYYMGPQDLKHGFEVLPDTMGQIHNHFINFKVDLDVLDEEN